MTGRKLLFAASLPLLALVPVRAPAVELLYASLNDPDNTVDFPAKADFFR